MWVKSEEFLTIDKKDWQKGNEIRIIKKGVWHPYLPPNSHSQVPGTCPGAPYT